MNTDLDLSEFCYSGLPIDNSLWVELGPEEDNTNELVRQGFHIPTKRLNRSWPEIITKEAKGKLVYVHYDPKVIGLPLMITDEMLEAKRKTINRYVVESTKTMKPVPPPETLSPEEWLRHERSRINFEAIRSRKRNLTEFERMIREWRPDYGFLVPYTERSKGLQALKYEVINEYFFHIPRDYFSGIVLSIGQEPNTNRAIWGCRRDFATDWPREFPAEFIGKMNFLTSNIEAMLK